MKIQEGRVSIKERIVIGEGGGRSLEADIFLPPIEEKNRPAVLLVHGGGWIEGDYSRADWRDIHHAGGGKGIGRKAMDPIYGAARHLFRAAENGDQGALLPEAIMPRDIDAAYRVQDALQALWVEAGAGEVAGWKVALTSKVMQELVGVSQPCEGAIFANRIHQIFL